MDDQLQPNDPATDSTNDHPTPDDTLEPVGDMYHPASDEEKLEEDNDPPAAPAEDNNTSGQRLDPDHPEFDYSCDAHETYDEGKRGATDVDATEETEQDLNPPRPLDPEA